MMNLYLWVAIQQTVASSTHVVARSVATVLPATTVVLYRGIFSVLVYTVWIVLRRHRVPKLAIKREDLWRFAVLGLVNMPLNQYLFVAGLHYTTAPNAALAFALSPVFVLVLARLLLGERFSLSAMIGILLAVAGAAVVAFGRGARFGADAALGNIMELAASFAWSLYTVWGRPLVQRYGAIPTTAIGMLWGLVLFVPVAFLGAGGILSPVAISTKQWIEIAYLGIVTSGVGWALWYMLLRRMEAGRLAVFNNLQPVLTVILAWLVFGELPPLEFWIGGSIALVGVAIVQRA
ncbi:MAG: DMT family transporter [Chlorobi bacterium]|nr:DMT family transporter [Chlorobiota bacterium]